MLKSPVALSFFLGLASLIVYIVTLSPTINFGDSPELISSAYTLGIAHPPGYPLYSLTGKLFAYLPWGESVARRVNLASAFFSAAGIFLLALVMASPEGGRSRPGAVFSALFLVVSPTLWSQSVISEVYALNLFLFTLLLYLTFRWWSGGDKRYLASSFFLWGVGLANHHTLIAFGPVLLFFLLLRRGKGIRDLKLYLGLAILFVLGLSTYIYLPLRSLQSPPMDWGDPESLQRFLDVLLRRQFPTGETGLTIRKGFFHLVHYLKAVVREFSLPATLIGLWGCVRFYRFGLFPFLFLLVLFLVHGTGTLLFLNPSADTLADIDVMMIPSFAIFALWIGWGVRDIIVPLSQRNWGRYAVFLFVILISANLAYMFSGSFAKNNQKNNYFALDYAENIFKSMEENGVIFVESDTALFPLWYLQFVESKRPDAAVIDVDFLMLPWFKGQIRERYKNIDIRVEDLGRHAAGERRGRNFDEMIDAYKVRQVELIAGDLIDARPVYISYEFGPVYRRFKETKDTYVINEGLVFRISRKYEKPDRSKWESYNLRSVLDYADHRDPYILALSMAYVKSLRHRALLLLKEGNREEAMKIMDRVREIMEEAAPYH